SGSGGIFKGNFGTLHLTNANTFTGGVTVTTGGILIQNNSALGTGTLTADAIFSTVTLGPEGSARTIANNVFITTPTTLYISSSLDLSINGVVSGPGGITKNGPSTLFLNKFSTFTGTLTI